MLVIVTLGGDDYGCHLPAAARLFLHSSLPGLSCCLTRTKFASWALLRAASTFSQSSLFCHSVTRQRAGPRLTVWVAYFWSLQKLDRCTVKGH